MQSTSLRLVIVSCVRELEGFVCCEGAHIEENVVRLCVCLVMLRRTAMFACDGDGEH
jgi:hypothetical protein